MKNIKKVYKMPKNQWVGKMHLVQEVYKNNKKMRKNWI